jgi:acetyltransferase-like isoleucine patch superfamily enzyme
MCSSTMFDYQNMGENVKQNLKSCGEGVKIYPLAKIVKPEVIEIGDHSMIDDFTFINGGVGIRMGRYVHIACFAGIVGGGELIVGDYAVVGYGSRLITGTDTYHGGKRMSSASPAEQRNMTRGTITIENDAFIGTNVVVHPNVRIGEGAIIGSNSLVLKDVEPWSISVGSPCRKIGERPRVTVEDI